MANKKITELNEATSVSNNDWLVIVDVANDETKKVHASEVGGNIPIQNTAPASPEENNLWIDTSEPEEYDEPIDYYSTTEVKTNKIWTNGKPVYRKVVNAGTLSNSQTNQIFTLLSGASNLVNAVAYTETSNHIRILPILNPQAPIDINWDLDKRDNTIYFETQRENAGDYSSASVVCIIEYTKTTD